MAVRTAPQLRPVLILSVFLPLLLPTLLSAATVNVSLGASIQTAIDGSTAGDVLQLAAGTYHQRFDFNGKAVTVRGLRDELGNLLTTIDGDAGGSVVRFVDGETRSSILEYVALANGKSTTVGGGGIYCGGADPLIRGCRIGGSQATQKGAGVAVTNCSPRFEDCSIAGNTCNQNGGGVAVTSASGVEFIRCRVSNNLALNTGGGFYLSKSSVLIGESEIDSNSASTDGGGLFLNEAAGTVIRFSKVTGCEALSDGAGLYSQGVGAWTLRNCVVSGNREAVSGCGLYLSGAGPANLLRNVISSNSASTQGGGVHLVYGASALLENNTIVGNSAPDGGGLYIATAGGNYRNNIIGYNSAGYGVSGDTYATPQQFSYCCFFGNQPDNATPTLATLLAARGNFAADPLFANRAGGDYHLKSRGGRYNAVSRSWVTDGVSSPCLDAGHPNSSFASEPAPNGGRVNIGAYGNTGQASKSAPPAVIGRSPKGPAVAVTANITVSFDVPMNRTSVNQALTINGVGASAFGGRLAWSGNKLTFNPTASLQPATSYRVVVGTGATSAAGISMASAYGWTFTTAASAPPLVAVAAAPAGAGACLTFSLGTPAEVTVSVTNLAGREVAVLAGGQRPAGAQSLLWNGRAGSGTAVPGGTYLLRLRAVAAGGESAQALATVRLGR